VAALLNKGASGGEGSAHLMCHSIGKEVPRVGIKGGGRAGGGGQELISKHLKGGIVRGFSVGSRQGEGLLA